MSPDSASILAFGEKTPDIHPSVFVGDGARIIGDVVIGESSSVWFNAVIRGDVHRVRIGRRVNVQDGAVLHVTHDTAPLDIGDDITIGHGAIVHGCTVEDGCLIGMGAVILDRAVLGSHSLIAAGSVVREGMHVPPGVLMAGNPASVKRELTQTEKDGLDDSASHYMSVARTYIQIYQER